MRPVVFPAEMAAIDAEAPEPVEELIERAGWATARAAADLLDGRLYGRRIVVLAGKGNNGADGRSAARHLEHRGARCTVIDVTGSGPAAGSATAHDWDLVIDACVGTGLGRPFDAATLPLEIGAAPVLAVDIPSGVDGATGQPNGRPVAATATVTFAAAKPGLLFHPGRALAGSVTVADIGLDCSRATVHLIGPDDLDRDWPRRSPTAHKRRRSVLVVGGSPGLTGAPALVAAGALRAGTGHVTVSIPGRSGEGGGSSAGLPADRGAIPVEAVEEPIGSAWAEPLLGRLDTGPAVGAVVLGPGLATDSTSRRQVRRYLAESTTPTVLDAGALHAFALGTVAEPETGRPAHADPDAPDPDAVSRDVVHPDAPDRDALEPGVPGSGGEAAEPVVERLPAPDGDDPQPEVRHVLTPHDGEFRVLTGRLPGSDRVADCRRAAAALGAVVLLKGPTTVVAHPDGRVLLSIAGDQRLATAGSGDVLAGVIATGLAGGLDPLTAAALGAELHGQASLLGYRVGLVAGDLPSLVAEALSRS